MSPVTVRGDDQLVAGLAKVGDGLSSLDGATRATAEILEADARGRAPKRTGALAGSIRGVAGQNSATVGTSIRYGAPVHNGVPSRGQRPQPFLLDAVKAQDSAVTSAWVKDIQGLIDRSI